MPKSWYAAALAVLPVWGFFIYWCAIALPWDPGLVGFLGTMLTLFPTALDGLRKFYLWSHRASPPPDPGQVQVAGRFAGVAIQALQNFSIVHALCFVFGLSGIAFAFARQYLSG